MKKILFLLGITGILYASEDSQQEIPSLKALSSYKIIQDDTKKGLLTKMRSMHPHVRSVFIETLRKEFSNEILSAGILNPWQVKGVISCFNKDFSKILFQHGHTMFMRDMVTKKVIRIMQFDPRVYIHFAFSSDSSKVLMRFYATVKIFDTLNGQELLAFELSEPINSAKFSKDGTKLIIIFGATVRIIDIQTGAVVTAIERPFDVGSTLSEDKELLIGNDATVEVRDIKTGKLLSKAFYLRTLSAAKLNADASKLITSSLNCAKVWDMATGETLITVKVDDIIDYVGFSPDGSKIYIHYSDQLVKIVDSLTSETIVDIKHDKDVGTPVFNYDGSKVVTNSDDGTAKIADLTSGEIIVIHHTDRVNSARFSPDGLKVITASADGSAKIVNVHTGKIIFTLSDEEEISEALFSPDGSKIITLCWERAMIYDATTGKLITQISHKDYIHSIKFNLDGSMVRTSASDGSKTFLLQIKNDDQFLTYLQLYCLLRPDMKMVKEEYDNFFGSIDLSM